MQLPRYLAYGNIQKYKQCLSTISFVWTPVNCLRNAMWHIQLILHGTLADYCLQWGVAYMIKVCLWLAIDLWIFQHTLVFSTNIIVATLQMNLVILNLDEKSSANIIYLPWTFNLNNTFEITRFNCITTCISETATFLLNIYLEYCHFISSRSW